MRRRRTDIPTAALVMELGKTEGRSGPEISGMTGVPRSTVENILSGAHGWDRIAQTEVFKLYRQEQNKALEQASRTLAADALKKAAEKMDAASFYQLVTGAAILIDKSRLLAGEPTENVGEPGMSSENCAEEDSSVMKDPAGCLVDKTASLSTRPSRIRRGDHRIRDFSLKGIIIPVLHHCQENEEPTYSVLFQRSLK